MAQASPPTTPRTSQSFFDRVLRSHSKNRRSEQEEETPRITRYFNVRRRLASSFPDETSRKRRGEVIVGAEAKTPREAYPNDSPITLHRLDSRPEEVAPSPPKRARETSALGFFDSMKPHELFDFMSSFPISHFTKLAILSSEWTKCVTNYIDTNSFRKRFVTIAKNYESGMNIDDPFIEVGSLIKAITVTKLPSDRIDKLLDFIEKCRLDFDSYDGWGRLINQFCERWAYHEMAKIVRAFKSVGDGRFTKLLRTVMKGELGEEPEMEMEVRRLARGFFLNAFVQVGSTSTDRRQAAFWLSAILRSLTSIQCQGRFCMIVFGPTKVVNGVESINWTDLVERPVASPADAEDRMKPLAYAIAGLATLRDHLDLASSAFIWRQDEVFNLIEEITTLPDPWSFDNFVALLMQKSCLLPIAVCTRMTHGHREEAGQIINSMKTLLYRWNRGVVQIMSRPFHYILEALDLAQRRAFLNSVYDSHHAQCKELLFMGVVAQPSYDEEMWAQQAFLPLLFEAADSIR